MLPHGNYVQRRIIRLPATALVKTVANAFIPTKLRTSNEDESANSLASFLKQINIILNRLADDNFEETLVDLRKISITNSDQLKELAKSVFQKVRIMMVLLMHVFDNFLTRQLSVSEYSPTQVLQGICKFIKRVKICEFVFNIFCSYL